MSRTSSHIIETRSKLIFESAITNYCSDEYDQGDLLFRVIAERDYGIDGQVEVFIHGETTGRIAFIQLKGTEKEIEKLKYSNEVSCYGVSKSNWGYCNQKNIPVILVYCSVNSGVFYYTDLQSKIADEESYGNYPGTVRIPIENNSSNLAHLIEIINRYYDDAREFDCQGDETCVQPVSWHIGKYLGNTYEGVDPWDEPFSIKIISYNNGELCFEWLNKVYIDDEIDACITLAQKIALSKNLVGDYHINKNYHAFKDQKAFLSYSYSGTIQLVADTVQVSFNDGNCFCYVFGGSGADDYCGSGGWRNGENLITVLHKK